MKHDTSFVRIIFITLFCLIVFPFAYQTIAQYRAAHMFNKNSEALEIVNEYYLIINQLNTFIPLQGYWPKSLDEAGYHNKEYLIEVDLSEPWILKAEVNNKVLNQDLIGKFIHISFDSNTHQLDCNRIETDLPRAFLPINCGGETGLRFGTLSFKTWSLLLAITSMVIIVLLALFRHPLLKLIRKNEFSLNRVKFNELKKLNNLAMLSGHRTPLLKANNLTLTEWQQLISIQSSKPRVIFKVLSRTLPVKSFKTEGKFIGRFMLSDQFELNLESLLVFVTDEVQSTRIISRINQMADQTTPVLIWLNNPETHIDVQLQSGRINKPCLIPSQQQMTQLMVFDTARTALILLTAKQLPINAISPYQGKGGITKSSHFFGRQTVLDKLESQSQTHFFLVGGRQLGKTSLLKALHRKLNRQPNNACHYISLSDDRLLARLAHHTGISEYTDLADLIAQYQKKHIGERVRFLIDEADLLIQSEIASGFKLMEQIRQVTEQGQCQFIFAGFWQLYATAVLDYHSPLRNLAETITVGALETKAACQLITQPMELLKQQYQSPDLVQDIYKQTGGRANLINIICEYLVEQLATEQKLISAALIAQAYQSERILDALLGWSNLTADKQACGLDRMIVYLIFIHQQVDLHAINQTLDDFDIVINPELLKQSLQRLRLAHVLLKVDNKYQFAVPLFAQLHDSNEAQALINQEVQFFKS